jgi:glutathione synthase/RimK-type ligase-like ATP-grasp enzyme
VLAQLLRDRGVAVTEVHDLDALCALDLDGFDACFPRFRMSAAHMAALDDALVVSGLPMINSHDCRRRCEQKALAHEAFARHGIPQPPAFVLGREGHLDRTLEWAGETLLKPIAGCRGGGIEILPTLAEAVERGRERREDLLVQQLLWPARCWRVVVGRRSGVVDPYWRRPPTPEDRVLSISTGSTIDRSGYSDAIGDVAHAMLVAVGGDILAADVLETDEGVFALEINHNFDAHGGDEQAAAAVLCELEAVVSPAGERALSATR